MSKVEMVAPPPWRTVWFKPLSANTGLGLFYSPHHWGFGFEFWPKSVLSIFIGPVAFSWAYTRPTTKD